MMKFIYTLFALTLLVACSEAPEQKITDVNQYNQYLATSFNESYQNALDEKEFWSNRLDEDSTGVGNLAPLAGAYEKLFATTGNGQYLLDAESLYKKGIEISAHSKDGYARGLARNYISQHRFKEAKEVMEASYAGVSNKKADAFVLFDIYMELGEYDKADEFLGIIKNNSDYNYLIRLAKWSDYKGNLDAAIKYLEQARDIAESRDSKPLKIWTYSNIADFYGHAGRLDDAYAHYIKTLELQPDNSYAKKGIAWILYSGEKNTSEANRIIDSVLVKHQVPDYYLLKSEMATYDQNPSEAKKYQDQFITKVTEGDYGVMYNAYLIEIYAETDPAKALTLAKQEVEARATPESYHLLAIAQLANGMKTEALETIEKHVVGKTYEPMALYHSAVVFRANGLQDRVKPIKEELLEASFEVGPVLFEEIEKL